MARQYVNSTNPATTLNGSINNSQTTIPVNSEANLPTTAPYTIIIGPDGGPYEFMLVTGGVGTGTLTATRHQESTSAASHANGESVYHVVTAGTIDAIRSDMVQIGAYSALPTSGMKAGDTFKCNDSAYEFIYTGSVWQAFYQGIAVTIPPTAGWTWSNQGSSSVVSTYGSLDFTWAGGGSDNLRAYMRTLPSTPYTCIIGVVANPFVGVTGTTAAIGGTCAPLNILVSDGTKYLNYGFQIFEQQGGGTVVYLRILQWNTTTSAASAYTTWTDTTGHGMWGKTHFLKLVDDGVNFTWYYSLEKLNWIELEQRSRSSFLTPTTIGVGAYAYTSSRASLVSCEGI